MTDRLEVLTDHGPTTAAYCVTPDCTNEATTGHLSAMSDDTPILELLCTACAGTHRPAPPRKPTP